MSAIRYEIGDATRPLVAGPRIIAHVCNDVGAWGAGFALAVSRRWREPKSAYKRWYAERAANDFALGAVQLVEVTPEIWVANMVGQHGIRRRGHGTVPVRYEAIDESLATVGDHAIASGASVHMPRIGCGLAGGDWSEVEPLIEKNLTMRGVETHVYDFER